MGEVKLPTGEAVPAFGVGTWHMGERAGARGQEVAALRYALDSGVRLIDTAEMYGSGGAEEIVGEAVAGRRDQVFIVSKLYPYNASATGTREACERSLKRLQSDHIDLYLLHWRGTIPLAATVEAFEELVRAGKIRHWGVSNFDTSDMAELLEIGAGPSCGANQVLYHLAQRGPEWRLLPYCQERTIPIMAYTPLGGRSVLESAELARIGQKHDVAPAAIALAWLLRSDGVMVIPKAAQLAHVDEIVKAEKITLDADDLHALDEAFPPPRGAQPLASA
jgi:diketogulonate reductase-like aldo/keto reductase